MKILKKIRKYKFLRNFFRNSNINNVTIKYEEYIRILKEYDKCILIDARNPVEYYENHLPGAINIPVYDIKKAARTLLKDKNQCIIVYCKSGSRSKKAVEELLNLGYNIVYNLIDVI